MAPESDKPQRLGSPQRREAGREQSLRPYDTGVDLTAYGWPVA